MAIAGKNQATGSSNDLVSVTLEARFDVSIHGSTRPGEGAASVDFEHMVYPPPPVINTSAGTARLVDTKGKQYVRQRRRHPAEPHGT